MTAREINQIVINASNSGKSVYFYVEITVKRIIRAVSKKGKQYLVTIHGEHIEVNFNDIMLTVR